jgi:predicted SprT family Zn-dependent metalloprotease
MTARLFEHFGNADPMSKQLYDRSTSARLRLDNTTLCATHMNYRCQCGVDYVVSPKEIPLMEDERLLCDNCGHELKGRWGSRNFDYAPRLLPEDRSKDP